MCNFHLKEMLPKDAKNCSTLKSKLRKSTQFKTKNKKCRKVSTYRGGHFGLLMQSERLKRYVRTAAWAAPVSE